MGKLHRIGRNEAGFASIVIALILLIVLSLLTVGFAQLARREKQSALDKQLANQAVFAAETGINDTEQAINNGWLTTAAIKDPSVNYDGNSCLTATQLTQIAALTGHASEIDPHVDDPRGISYSCVIVNLTPPSLQYNLSPGDSRIATFTLTPAPSGGSFSLTVQWGSGDNSPATPHNAYPASTAPKFLPSSSWNATKHYLPVLQVSITPVSAAPTRGGLTSSDFTAYLYPSSNRVNAPGCGAGPTSSCVNYDLANPSLTQAQIVAGDCGHSGSAQWPCSVTINNIPYSAGTGGYLLHFLDFYDASSINATAADTSGGAATLDFSGAQNSIDVTGRAKNVLKRLQVRVTPNGTVQTPGNAISSGNVCKHFQTDPVAGTIFRDAQTGADVTTSGKACDLE